ncbi:hypothetical protein ACWEQ2_36930 [Streptomyces sp. NPDC004096]|uniref:hypothetical protein n=1 Tax=unclassified Streptomyces TaxID=2593676 RepID=UPI0033BE4912
MAGVLALLVGATLAFVALAAGGTSLKPDRGVAAGTRIWAAFHLPVAACTGLVSLLLTRCCSGPLL